MGWCEANTKGKNRGTVYKSRRVKDSVDKGGDIHVR